MENKNEVIFTINDPEYVAPENTLSNPPTIELLRLSKDGFFYKGEKVEDIHNVYERFNEWLTKSEEIK